MSNAVPTSATKNLFRFQIRKTVEQTHQPWSNIFLLEKQAIRELKNNDNIIILPADKGRTVVMLDGEVYHQTLSS